MNFTTNHNFPFQEYKQIGLDIERQQQKASLAKAKWLECRNLLSAQQQRTLDIEFKSSFESLSSFFYSPSSSTNAEEHLDSLYELIEKGASAALLDTYELGKFNLATAVKSLIEMVEEKKLVVAEKIITASLVASPDLVHQKAYAGNGGAPTLYWLCEYLSKGIGDGVFDIKTEYQYSIFFRIFCNVTTYFPETLKAENYWLVYQQLLRPSSAIRSMQMEVFLRLINYGYEKPDPMRYHPECFTCIPSLIKTSDFDWIPLFFPYPDNRISKYIQLLEDCLSIIDLKNVLNGFKTTKSGRKFFLEYFADKEHWLLSTIVKQCPECIFKLVQGNEIELLQPFLKNYKKELSSIIDKRGNNLLYIALNSGNPSEGIIIRLVQIGCSVSQKNNQGESALDLAIRKKRNNMIELLKKKP